MSAGAPRLVDVHEIARELNERARALCAELLPAGRRDGHEWRVGSVRGERGESLGVHLDGQKAGVWCDFSTGECGDALDLVAAVRCAGDKKEALGWARRWLALEPAPPERVAPTEAPRSSDEDRAARRNLAFRLWLGGHAEILDTPVDRYLAARGICLRELERRPRAIRFHGALWHQRSARAWPAMVTAVVDGDGRFVACHRTWLEVRPEGVRKAPIEPAKAVLGDYRGGAVRLWRGASGKPFREVDERETVDLVEGIEDGLSVAYAAPECRVLAAVSLSNLGHIQLPPQLRRVRLWRQNDTAREAIAGFERAVRTHLAAGREVLIAAVPAHVKDVNELLTRSG